MNRILVEMNIKGIYGIGTERNEEKYHWRTINPF